LDVFDKLYSLIRKEELKKSETMLKKMKIETLFDILSKDCWEYGIQYDVLLKRTDTLEIKMKGRKQHIVLKFHKTNRVSLESYLRFLRILTLSEGQRGVYITTGVFEEHIWEQHKRKGALEKRVIIEDSFHFLRSQIGLANNSEDIFINNRLMFYKYLPN
jgi:hypothetical protein